MISYTTSSFSGVKEDQTYQVINEAYDFLKENGFNQTRMLDLLSDENAFDEYVDKLCEGTTEGEKEALRSLYGNWREQVLNESATANIAPIAFLVGPMYRKFFPKLAIKDAFPTEVATKPQFNITWLTPMLIKRNATTGAIARYEIPKVFRDEMAKTASDANNIFGMKRGYTGWIPVADVNSLNLVTMKKNSAGSVISVEPAYTTPLAWFEFGVTDEKIDRNLIITNVRMIIGWGSGGASTTYYADVPCQIKINANDQFYGEAIYNFPTAAQHAATPATLNSIFGTLTTNGEIASTSTSMASPFLGATAIAGAGAATVINAVIGKSITIKVFGKMDFMTSELDVTTNVVYSTEVADTNSATRAIDIANAIKVQSYLSTEYATYGDSIEFDVQKREVAIGVGAPLYATLPTEFLTDMMAIYQIDGSLKVTDIMSTTFAHRMEVEAWTFLKASFTNNSSLLSPYTAEFNAFPPREFAGMPGQWREELKRVIDYFSAKMRLDYSYPGGRFVLLGSPLDMQLINNIQWVFTAGQNTEATSGVEVNYSVGNYQGANNYLVISSDYIPQGTMRIMFYPSDPEQMTYKYYPYSFNIENSASGYRNPNHPNAPSIMMNKRHKFEEFMPLQAVINIRNNNGKLPPRYGFFPQTNTNSYFPTDTVDDAAPVQNYSPESV